MWSRAALCTSQRLGSADCLTLFPPWASDSRETFSRRGQVCGRPQDSCDSCEWTSTLRRESAGATNIDTACPDGGHAANTYQTTSHKFSQRSQPQDGRTRRPVPAAKGTENEETVAGHLARRQAQGRHLPVCAAKPLSLLLPYPIPPSRCILPPPSHPFCSSSPLFHFPETRTHVRRWRRRRTRCHRHLTILVIPSHFEVGPLPRPRGT